MICRRRLASVISLLSGAGKKPFRRQWRASSNRMRIASGSSTFIKAVSGSQDIFWLIQQGKCKYTSLFLTPGYLFFNFKWESYVPAKKELRRLSLRVQHCQVRHNFCPDSQVLQGFVVRLQLQVWSTQNAHLLFYSSSTLVKNILTEHLMLTQTTIKSFLTLKVDWGRTHGGSLSRSKWWSTAESPEKDACPPLSAAQLCCCRVLAPQSDRTRPSGIFAPFHTVEHKNINIFNLKEVKQSWS